MRRPALPYELLASFSRARAERLRELTSGTKVVMDMNTTPPRDPSQVPDGDLSDAIKPNNPTPSDFNDDEDVDDEDGFDDDDDTFDDGEDDDD